MNKKERKFLYKAMKHVSDIVVEVGCWKGKGSEQFAKGIERWNPETKLYCVDLFSQEYFSSVPDVYPGIKSVDIKTIFDERMKIYPHNTMIMGSLVAATEFKDESIGFILIDADHSYGSVKADIEAWWPKIKIGGVMCGHDYDKPHTPGVKKAVDEKFDSVELISSIWKVVK